MSYNLILLGVTTTACLLWCLPCQAQPELQITVEKKISAPSYAETGMDHIYVEQKAGITPSANIYHSAINTGGLVSATLVVHRDGHTYLTYPGSAWATGANVAKTMPAKPVEVAAR